MFPSILSQLGMENFLQLSKYASPMSGDIGHGTEECEGLHLHEDNDDDVPELVGNFDDVSKSEVV